MIYGSVCSGIEAATAAWHPLGWTPAWFSEIEPFPCAVLQHHYPHVQNLGDMTKIREKNCEPIEFLVGGTPCQSFSVAGLRKGLADPRGNLALEFLAIADRLRPRWILWENVPGVLSSNGGRDFGSFLGALVQLGYGFAYRVYDAQFFGVAQRRRRVFVVGYLGDWRPPAAVLFERYSLSWHPAPSRKAGQGVAGTIEASAGRSRGSGINPSAIHNIAGPMCSNGGTAKKHGFGMGQQDWENGYAVPVAGTLPADYGKSGGNGMGSMQGGVIAHTLTRRCDGGSDGAGQGMPIIPILEVGARTGKSTTDLRAGGGIGEDGDPMFTLQSGKHHAVGFHQNQAGEVRISDIGYTVSTNSNASGRNTGMLATSFAVRRLTPSECEKLQGFSPGYTRIPWRGKPAEECPDGPRYKAIGNSMAVPVMRWMGERIQMVEDLNA